MGTRTYKSDEFDRFTAREKRREEWLRQKRYERRRAIAILSAFGVVALAVVVLLVWLIAQAVSDPDTAAKEKSLSEKESGEISLVDNTSDEALSFGTDEHGGTTLINKVSERGLIVIDPGHGGYDSGILSAQKYEKDVDLEIAVLLSEKLKDKGFSVYMTRNDDSFVGANDRADLANSQEGALALISIHMNSSDKDSDEGVEVFTTKNEANEQLAQLIVDEISENTGAINGGVKISDNLVICSKAEMPAVVVECGYLTNKREARNLWDASYQNKIANAVVNAVNSFLPEKQK